MRSKTTLPAFPPALSDPPSRIRRPTRTGTCHGAHRRSTPPRFQTPRSCARHRAVAPDPRCQESHTRGSHSHPNAQTCAISTDCHVSSGAKTVRSANAFNSRNAKSASQRRRGALQLPKVLRIGHGYVLCPSHTSDMCECARSIGRAARIIEKTPAYAASRSGIAPREGHVRWVMTCRRGHRARVSLHARHRPHGCMNMHLYNSIPIMSCNACPIHVVGSFEANVS